jgi:RNA polymerase sigma-70 factor (ECF subfamily)
MTQRAMNDSLIEHAEWLRRLATSLVRDHDTADDLTQEALIAATRRRGASGGLSRGWLRVVMLGLFKNHLRAEGRRARRERVAGEADEERGGACTPAELLEMNALLNRLLSELPEPYRETLVATFFLGMSSSEVGKQQGVPASTVRARVTLSLQMLRQRLDEEHRGNRREWKRALAPLILPRTAGPVPPVAYLAPFGGAAVALGLTAIMVTATRREPPPAPPFPQSEVPAARGVRPDPRDLPATATQPAAIGAWGDAPIPGGRRDDPRGDGVPPASPVLSFATSAAEGRCGRGGDLGDVAEVLRDGRPRLFVTAERLCALRAASRHPHSVRREIFGALRARVDTDRPDLFSTEQLNYGRSSLAASAAFMFLLTGESHYAEQAFRQARAVIDDESIEGTPAVGYGIARAKTGLGLALVFDWAYHGLSEAQRNILLGKLSEALDAWPRYDRQRGGALAYPFTSYWVPVCRGSELIQMLAANAETARAERFELLKALLQTHLANGFTAAGLGQEGMEYTAAGATFLLPAALLLRDRGDAALEEILAARPVWRPLMYLAASGGPPGGPSDVVPYGMSKRYGGPDTGFASLAFTVVPPADLPAYRYFYDRHLGRGAERAAGARFDPNDLGPLWALIGYREDVHPEPPPARGYGVVLADAERGTYLFRNRWRDDEDVQVAIFGGRGNSPVGWRSPQTFDLGLRAFGTRFFGWPGDAKRRPALLSTLLIDGSAFGDWDVAGGPTRVETFAGGGLVTVDGGDAYRRPGIDAAERQLLVRFLEGRGGLAAVIATRDRIVGRGAHTFTWQINPGGHAGDGGLTVTAVEGDGAGSPPSFLLSGHRDAYLRGFVVGPPGTRVLAGDPVRVQTSGADAEIVVVMAVGRGAPPTARVSAARRGLTLTPVTAGPHESATVEWTSSKLGLVR